MGRLGSPPFPQLPVRNTIDNKVMLYGGHRQVILENRQQYTLGLCNCRYLATLFLALETFFPRLKNGMAGRDTSRHWLGLMVL